jgi:hypothetical protein
VPYVLISFDMLGYATFTTRILHALQEGDFDHLRGNCPDISITCKVDFVMCRLSLSNCSYLDGAATLWLWGSLAWGSAVQLQPEPTGVLVVHTCLSSFSYVSFLDSFTRSNVRYGLQQSCIYVQSCCLVSLVMVKRRTAWLQVSAEDRHGEEPSCFS